jgi:site-specific recombinase XerD
MDFEIELPKSGQISTNLEKLAHLASSYAKAAKSKNTQKAYRSDWNDFRFWCESQNLSFLPAKPETVATYLSDRATNHWVDKNEEPRAPLKTSSIIRRLTSISQAHKFANAHFDRKHIVIQETLKGILNTFGSAQERKEPILIGILRQMIEWIPIEKNKKPFLKGIRDRSLLLMGFAGAFRRAELVSLETDDLKWSEEGILVTIKRSKTDQTGKGRDVAIPFGSNPITCPVRSLKAWLESAEISKGPLFRPINRHGKVGEKALTGHAVALIIKSNAYLSEKFEDFSGHSLRAGFTTTAAKAGVPEHIIMKQTGHKKSDTIKKYIRLGTVWEENAAYKVGL